MISQIIDAVKTKYKDNEERLNHIEGVVSMAVKLAKHYGENAEHAEIAAWIHDYTKYDTITDQIRYIDLKLVKKYTDIPLIYHALSAAELLDLKFDIHNKYIQDAVRYHVWGRVGMTKLDKIILLADKTEETRNYEGVDDLRKLAFEDLDKAVIKTLEENIRYLESVGKNIHADQHETLSYLKEHYDGKN